MISVGGAKPVVLPAICLVATLLTGCDGQKNWTLFVYPGGEGGFAAVTPGFDREMCEFAGAEAVQSHLYAPGRQELIDRGDSGIPTFECGRNCRIGDLATVAMCDETFDADG